MSLLPATSHANPTTPFWASASGGGGGGGGPLITIPDIVAGATANIPFGSTDTLFSFPIPDGIAVGDDFIVQGLIHVEDWDYTGGPYPVLSGLLEFVLIFSDDDKSWGVSNAVYLNVTNGLPNITNDVPITLVAHRGEGASNINVIWRNKIQQASAFSILSSSIGNITFTRVGTGLVIS